MKIAVDGVEYDLPDGSALGDALERAGATHPKEAVIGIIKGRGEKAKETNSYWLDTTKGKIRIELLESDLQKAWHASVDGIKGTKVRWSTPGAVSFGDFPADVVPGRDDHQYNRWDVIIGTSGFEADKSQLIFARRIHSAVYGVPPGRGVFARVVGGKATIDKLEEGDRITGVEPIVEWEDLTEKLVTDDISTPLSEGMEIFTVVRVNLMEEAPHGAEFFLASTMEGIFKITSVSSSYISSDSLIGEQISFEHREPRLEGTVSVRTKGRGLGRIFVYKGDRTSNPAHSVVGRVTGGIDLIKLAAPGHNVSVEVSPKRIMLMGSPLKEALKEIKERGVQAEVEGYQGEDAVVVGQEPLTTMEVLGQEKVNLTTIPAQRLISIELYDDLAPKTLDYFRHVVGLKERPVGPLPVFFVYENTVLFKPEIQATSYKELLPENKPTGPVPPGSIGVSNTVSKKIGLIGVKMVEEKRFGPSGEKFDATNIIGRIIDLDKLKDVAEGETVYVLEVRR